ncbi:PLP-dependent aminotransferase family protein [Pseudomonas nitroreducens]|uniref:MocR-like pyridoxine biosynthesis transcription factor PdxR n=1 Tax=Pseudomonas TaxID=286 RepID=UPI0007EE49C4|nr:MULTISPECIES: PLP-dependent aminotransferase family protein [Pseudomonas]MDH1072365.1 PLP-dependent aminotransferase family protein [Pseudomonas nitroreducens]NMZ71947.1 PLP-dependent aminotransferase family protein [Pseudomonas nitroreducens]OBY57871.1 DNA-binding protein [Pseudomonas sp. AU12215]UCL86411.1 PLP-dependent aminotransferase family protein [Pseudomonas sp. HS-18]
MSTPTDSFRQPLDPSHELPIYRQLYGRIRDAITRGALRPGERVPPVRGLAGDLGVARGTVELAYQLLTSEGYLLARGPAGTVVSPQLAGRTEAALPIVAPPATVERSLPGLIAHGPALRPFQLGVPALDAFPRALWSRLCARRLRQQGASMLAYPEPCGYGPLREAVAGYLGISRGIACDPAQVFICAGYQGALDLISRTLLEPGQRFWHEDPGYPRGRELLRRAGGVPVPVAVDADGLRVEDGIARAPDARFALITPSQQSPTGVALSLPRRLALLDWAASSGAWIVEDDYDSEYRYAGFPLPALKSLDRAGRVLYTGTFSKVLYPALRLGYLVVPAELVEDFVRTQQVFTSGCAELLQATLCDFMQEGHFARHLKRTRTLYALRRQWLRSALEDRLGERLRFADTPGGLHLVGALEQDDLAVARRAHADGLGLQALNAWCVEARREPALLMSFTNVSDEKLAGRLAERLAPLLD